MEAEQIDIPNELMILNPELQKKPVLIGREAYMVYPLTEGQAERVSKLISDIIIDISTMDMKCPNCNHVFRNMLGRQEKCNRCKTGKGYGGSQLVSMQKPPVEALTHDDRIPKLLEELVGISASSVKESLTINQGKHIAGVLYVQNFMEGNGSGLPEDSRKNFHALLEWVGLGAQENPEKIVKEVAAPPPLEKSMNPLPTSMDSQENISKEDGNPEEADEAVDSL